METGDLEIEVDEIKLLNPARRLPFTMSDNETLVNEELRYRYRYLDIRLGSLQKNLKIRAQVSKCVRDYLAAHGRRT